MRTYLLLASLFVTGVVTFALAIADQGLAFLVGFAVLVVVAASLCLSVERDREIADAMRRHPAGGRR